MKKLDKMITHMTPEEIAEFDDWVANLDPVKDRGYIELLDAGERLFNLVQSIQQKQLAFLANQPKPQQNFLDWEVTDDEKLPRDWDDEQPE